MKRSLTAGYLVVALAFLLSPPAIAQQGRADQKSASALSSILAELNERFKEGGVLQQSEFTGLRRSLVRFKQREGCEVTIQVSQVPSRASAQNNRAATELTVEEWRVNLSDLDADQVKIEKMPRADYRAIRFTTRDNKELIEWRGIPPGDRPSKLSTERLVIAQEQSSSAAALLIQAIQMCTKQ